MPSNITLTSMPGRVGIQDPAATVAGLAAVALTANSVVEIDATSLNTLSPGSTRYPNEGGLGDTATDWCLGGVWDNEFHRGFTPGSIAGYDAEVTTTSGITSLDLTRNIWRRNRRHWQVALGHCYDGCALDQEGILYKMYFGAGATVLRWNTRTNQPLPAITAPSTSLGSSGSWPYGNVHACAWHPNLGTQGSLIYQSNSRDRILRWDKATATWSALANPEQAIVSMNPYAHYNPNADVVVCGQGANGFTPKIVDNTGAITSANVPPVDIFTSTVPFNTNTLFLPDPHPTSTKSLLIYPDGNIYELETTTGVWTSVVMPAALSANSYEALTDCNGYSIPSINAILIASHGSSGTSKVHLYRRTV